MSAGTCRCCGCTEARGCAAGCGWVDEARDICSLCFLGEHLIRFVLAALERITGEAPIDWVTRPVAHQHALAMSARGFIEAMPSPVEGDLALLREQFSELMVELEARAPDTLEQCRHEAASLKDTVLAVFDPPGRIVLASQVPAGLGGRR